MQLSKEEAEILMLASTLLDNYYNEKEKTCREFKWICIKHLPQSGEGYTANKNIYEIQDKTIADIKEEKDKARKIISTLLQQLTKDK